MPLKYLDGGMLLGARRAAGPCPGAFLETSVSPSPDIPWLLPGALASADLLFLGRGQGPAFWGGDSLLRSHGTCCSYDKRMPTAPGKGIPISFGSSMGLFPQGCVRDPRRQIPLPGGVWAILDCWSTGIAAPGAGEPRVPRFLSPLEPFQPFPAAAPPCASRTMREERDGPGGALQLDPALPCSRSAPGSQGHPSFGWKGAGFHPEWGIAAPRALVWQLLLHPLLGEMRVTGSWGGVGWKRP